MQNMNEKPDGRRRTISYGYKELACEVLKQALAELKSADTILAARAMHFFQSEDAEFWCEAANIDIRTWREKCDKIYNPTQSAPDYLVSHTAPIHQ